MFFCPLCGNLLLIQTDGGQNDLVCSTCPYKCPVRKPITKKIFFLNKEQDDVLGGEGAWDNVQATEANCPGKGCDNTRAYFFQLQIRSGDEPMTTFYKCTDCGLKWKEN
ncbi:hypothetical protein BJ742DRAFT_828476 [Cladochytrium replicatum]|nr:hypothetical protein BJ742DRAFT_828476 [Cladochytrium replicatum]